MEALWQNKFTGAAAAGNDLYSRPELLEHEAGSFWRARWTHRRLPPPSACNVAGPGPLSACSVSSLCHWEGGRSQKVSSTTAGARAEEVATPPERSWAISRRLPWSRRSLAS